MLLTFLTPRVELLGSDGQLSTLQEAGSLGRVAPSVVLIARELCTFQAFSAPLPGGRQLAQAARLHAVASPPYARSAHVLARSSGAVGIWWWDVDRVSGLLENAGLPPTLRVTPETLAQPPGDRLRLVKLASGFEAQAWKDGKLVASAWRSARFDPAAWAQFTRGVGIEAGSESPPAAITLPASLERINAALEPSPPDLATAAKTAGAALGVLLAGAIALNLGQAWRLTHDTAGVEKRAETLKAALPQDSGEARRRLAREAAVFDPAAASTSPLSAAGVIVGITALLELTPTRLTIEAGEAELVLPYAAIDRVGELTPELEGSGYFTDVRPETNSDAGELIYYLRIRPGLAPISADE